MSEIGVNFGNLSTTQAHIAKTVGDMNQQLADLKNYLKPMISTWEGDASTQYQALQNKWDQAAAELNQVLNQISTATANAHDGFQSTEKANASRFAG